jgi:mevalonate kinase
VKSPLQNSLFYAKVLLFGEYGIMEDAMGLSIPFQHFQGRFKAGPALTEDQKKSNTSLKAFANYLRELSPAIPGLDLSRLDKDLEAGLSFESNIPQGFGVGSSGALVAAVYEQYGPSKDARSTRELNLAIQDPDAIQDLKSRLGRMESFFHGRSSGMDPLICYLKIPILMDRDRSLGQVTLPQETPDGRGAIFLLNTGQPGETQPLVSVFLEKLKHEGFRRMIRQEFNEYNNECIKAFLSGKPGPLFKNLRSLSHLVLQHFQPMIPEKFRQVWQQGIDSGVYYLKLCGSGGGGYLLGFTRDLEQTQRLLDSYELRVIHRF